MTNLHIAQMRDCVRNFYKKQIEIQKKMDENARKYSADYCETIDAELRQEAVRARQSALSTIDGIFLRARSEIASQATLDGSAITKDAELFQDGSGFQLSTDAIRGFCEKYKNNYTMSELIRSYCDRHEIKDVRFTSPEERLEVYRLFGQSAKDLIRKAGNADASEAEVNGFANEAFPATAELLAKVDDSSTQTGEHTATHRFDGVVLQ